LSGLIYLVRADEKLTTFVEQIQKVSAQLQVGKGAPQTVVNNQ